MKDLPFGSINSTPMPDPSLARDLSNFKVQRPVSIGQGSKEREDGNTYVGGHFNLSSDVVEIGVGFTSRGNTKMGPSMVGFKYDHWRFIQGRNFLLFFLFKDARKVDFYI